MTSSRIRPGHPAVIVNASAGGALVETPRRLLPGSTIELQFDRGGTRLAVRAVVVRSSVSRLHSASVWYRGAVSFESPVPGFPATTADGYSVLPHVQRDATPFRAPTTPDVL